VEHPSLPDTELQDKHSNEVVLETAKSLLTASGFSIDDVETALNAIKTAKEQSLKKDDGKYKNYIDKTAVYDDVDAWIYKRGDTKSGIWYFRIYDYKTQKPVFKSLKTTDKTKALATARILYIEIKGKIERGERIKQITTPELVELWDKWLRTQITDEPHKGIVLGTYKVKRNFLNNWLEYITDVLHVDKIPIDKIKPHLFRGFSTWLENKPKQTALQTGSRCREKINNNVNEVLRMYHKLAVRDRYISNDAIPQIDRLKYEIDDTAKRHIFSSLDQYGRYCTFLKRKYVTKKHNPLVPPEELEKRKIFCEFILIITNAGFRTKELLGMKVKDVTELLNPKEDDKQMGNVVLNVRRENAKTGRSRMVVAPLRKRLDRIYASYKKMGIVHEPDDFIFINPLSRNRNHYGRMIMYQRLKKTLISSGVQDELDKEGKRLSPYSMRHYYAYLRLVNGVPIHILAENMGTSVDKIEKTYGHINTQLHADVITKGQGILISTETNVDVTRTIKDDRMVGV